MSSYSSPSIAGKKPLRVGLDPLRHIPELLLVRGHALQLYGFAGCKQPPATRSMTRSACARRAALDLSVPNNGLPARSRVYGRAGQFGVSLN
jgi:hypothetical protein